MTPGSPAACAGIQVQDVVTAINNDPINENNSLHSLLFKYRGSKAIQLNLTLVARSA